MNGQSGTFDAGERVLVVGLGRSGLASCTVLRARGVTVFATDEKPPEALGNALRVLERSGALFVAPGALDDLAATLTSCVVSPGIPLTNPLVRRLQNARLPVYSEIEVAYRIARAPIVAVTGTKGKTTTTALLGAMFSLAGKTTHVGGNIGNALIAETFNAAAGDWIIAEVSSFQLESIRSFKPKIATILNVSPDHLDRYRSMEEYAEAKFRIFANQGPSDTFVGNLDDSIVATLLGPDAARRIHARTRWFARNEQKAAALFVRDECIVYVPPNRDALPFEIMPIAEIPLRGEHNLRNVLAALLVALSAGLDPAALREAVRGFQPLAHRLQCVAERDGVLFIDDSKATNPRAAVAALESFTRPVVLIAGGRSKRTDFRELGEAVRRRAKAVVLIGEAADEIAGVVDPSKVVRAGSLDEAVALATAIARSGDVVLLSPGCASFDMFSSAEARGEAFARAAAGVALAHG